MHPQLCLDAIQFGVEHGGYAGLQKARKTTMHISPSKYVDFEFDFRLTQPVILP